jgi:hypothetical protein
MLTIVPFKKDHPPTREIISYLDCKTLDLEFGGTQRLYLRRGPSLIVKDLIWDGENQHSGQSRSSAAIHEEEGQGEDLSEFLDSDLPE